MAALESVQLSDVRASTATRTSSRAASDSEWRSPARSIANPQLLVCDEVTSALDVSVQAAIIDVLAELQRELGIGLLFVTHNLALIRTLSQEVAVMSEGRIVERGARRPRPRRPPGRVHEEAALGHAEPRGRDGAPAS